MNMIIDLFSFERDFAIHIFIAIETSQQHPSPSSLEIPHPLLTATEPVPLQECEIGECGYIV